MRKLMLAQRPMAQVTCQQTACALAAMYHYVCATAPPIIPTKRPDHKRPKTREPRQQNPISLKTCRGWSKENAKAKDHITINTDSSVKTTVQKIPFLTNEEHPGRYCKDTIADTLCPHKWSCWGHLGKHALWFVSMCVRMQVGRISFLGKSS